MSTWKVKFFDECDRLLKEKIVEVDSKYALKKKINVMVNDIEGCCSYSYKESKDDEEDK